MKKDMLRSMLRRPFHNSCVHNLRRSIWDFFLWKIGHYNDATLPNPIPESFSYPAKPKKFIGGLPTAIWIGHSTFLIEIENTFILTDPIWDDYCSPIPLKILKRKEKPPISLEDLPPIDFVLLSHNHYDHLDVKTVHFLKHRHPETQWILPEKVSRWFHKRKIQNTVELKWWEFIEQKGCTITSVPAQHFSGRTLWDRNRTHWSGYILEKGSKKFYFSGDTGYNEHDFKKIGERFQSIDLSLIPIGAYLPEKFMQPVHINPFQAVQIHLDVNSKLSLGMHWNTFRLSDEPLNRPPYDLYLAMKKRNLAYQAFLPIEVGTYVNF